MTKDKANGALLRLARCVAYWRSVQREPRPPELGRYQHEERQEHAASKVRLAVSAFPDLAIAAHSTCKDTRARAAQAWEAVRVQINRLEEEPQWQV